MLGIFRAFCPAEDGGFGDALLISSLSLVLLCFLIWREEEEDRNLDSAWFPTHKESLMATGTLWCRQELGRTWPRQRMSKPTPGHSPLQMSLEWPLPSVSI